MLPEPYLLPAVEGHGLAGYFVRVDGLPGGERGGTKLGHLVPHLARLGAAPARTVMIGDTVDDAVARAAPALAASSSTAARACNCRRRWPARACRWWPAWRRPSTC